MNAYAHSQFSVKNRGGKIEDYLELHNFSDCSKEICALNSHRLFFHTMWGVKNVMVRIFGHTFTNSDNKVINVKDCCENDHILPDYRNRFIPTLSDFIDCIDDEDNDLAKIQEFWKQNEEIFKNPEIKQLMMSPLPNTGKIKSLLITHNSWFIGEILPRCFPEINLKFVNYSITPKDLFNRMEFKDWMQNGKEVPPSFQKINKKYNKENVRTEPLAVDFPASKGDNFKVPGHLID